MSHPGKFVVMAIMTGIGFLILFATKVATPFSIVSASAPVPVEVTTESVVQEIQEIQPTEMAATETSPCSISSAFPGEIHTWCEPIQKAADQYQIDANLLAAVMLQESGGKPDAYSSSGAVGLMQIMPRDGIAASFQCINGPCFSSRPSIEELLNPTFNIDYGSKMLLNLFNRHGNWRDALKAYGPMDRGYYYADLVLTIYENYR